MSTRMIFYLIFQFICVNSRNIYIKYEYFRALVCVDGCIVDVKGNVCSLGEEIHRLF